MKPGYEGWNAVDTALVIGIVLALFALLVVLSW